MDLLTLILFIVIFAAIIWGGFYICDRAQFPPPVRWIFGVVCLIILLAYLLRVSGFAPALHLR